MTQIIDIDIRGQICPSCLLLTLKELNHHGAAVRAGSVEVVVMTDDRQATANIPATAERMGFRTEVVRLEGGNYRIRIFGAT
jgi:TusA-related sulfurtransferase